MQRIRNNVDMTEGAILPKLSRVALPLILSGILQLLFNAADIVVVGNFGSDNSVAAVGSTGALVGLMVNLFVGLSTGANVLCALFTGAKEGENLSKAIHTSIFTAIASGAILTVAGFVFAEDILVLMKAPEEVLPLSALYLRIYFCGMIAMMLYNFGSSILRAKGDTKRPLYFLTIAGVINVVLNLIFVIFFHMDVAGVALATVISQCVSAVLVIRCLMKETDDYKLEWKKVRLHGRILLRIMRIGIPAGLQGVVFSLSNVVIQSSINSFGPIVMSGSAASASIEGFVYVAMNSFSVSVLSFVSQNIGAQKFSRINRIILTSFACVAVVGFVLGNVTYLFGKELIRLYDPRPEILEPGLMRMQLVCGTYFICGLMDCACSILRGLGKSVLPMLVALIGVCGLRLLWIFTVFQIPAYHTIRMLFVSYPLSWGVTFVVHLISILIVRRKFPKVDVPLREQEEAA